MRPSLPRAPHSGKFANPGSGPYEIRFIGRKDGRECSDSLPARLELVIEFVVRDSRPTVATPEVSGLEDLADVLKVVMKLGARETVLSSISGL